MKFRYCQQFLSSLKICRASRIAIRPPFRGLFAQPRHIQQMNQSDQRISAPFSSTRGRPKSRHPSSQSTPPAPSSIQNNPFTGDTQLSGRSPNDWPIGQMKSTYYRLQYTIKQTTRPVFVLFAKVKHWPTSTKRHRDA